MIKAGSININLYQERLKEKKDNAKYVKKRKQLDNGLMECFFGLLKSEMFYGQEATYRTLDELKEAIEDYIYYYNNKRIQEKQNGCPLFNTGKHSCV